MKAEPPTRRKRHGRRHIADGDVLPLAIRSLNEKRAIFVGARLPTAAFELKVQVGINDGRGALTCPERDDARLEWPHLERNPCAGLYVFENCNRLDTAGFQIP